MISMLSAPVTGTLVRSSTAFTAPTASLIRATTEYDKGGHFASMEVPEVVAADVRDFFAGVRG